MRRKWGESVRRGRHWLTHALFAACVCGTVAPRVLGQEAASPQQPGAKTRLLSAAEGKAIVDAARDQGQPARGTQDCSHLVHKIYEDAGFDYPYVSSFEIYAGSDSFERVKMPQPGDVVAWPGHVGIVLDPLEHSFYSLVRTGLDAQDYDGPYWRSRGRPRFFRYVLADSEEVVAARAAPVAKVPARSKPQKAPGTAQGREDVESTASAPGPRVASERTAVIYGPPAPATVTMSTAKAVEIPASIVIGMGQQKPTREEVTEGVLEVNNAAGSVLRKDDPLKATRLVVIFDRLNVERLEMKRDHGWAHLVIESRASIGSAGPVVKAKREKVRWELKRTELGWEAITPVDRNYVPNDVAVRILAQQLARLTESDAAAEHQDGVLRQEAQIASLLSVLLENK